MLNTVTGKLLGWLHHLKKHVEISGGQYGYPFGQSTLYAQLSILTYLALTLKLSSIIVVFGW